MNVELQEYGKASSTSPRHPLPPAVNSWLKELSALLEEASDLAQHCTVPSYSHLFSRYRMGRKIKKLTANVGKHLASALFVALLQLANRQVLEHIKERVNSLDLPTPALPSSGTSGNLFPSPFPAACNNNYIGEALIVGQDSASNSLKELIHSQQHKKLSRFGLVGKGGTGTLSSRLRLSYDTLADVPGYGISLQLCSLCLASFSEDHVIGSTVATTHWIGEGLVAGVNAFQIGDMYLNLLADRCLIEPGHKDYKGKVIYFRVHDVLHDLAHQIAEKEEKCFFKSGRVFSEFPADHCSGHVRISLLLISDPCCILRIVL
ncbi:hypothetical protein SUGI_0172200 [Cryptomeria japonica]|nr:hypothetical protein SUGI_0172200 [Cryptomeria japonica]